MDLNEAVKIVRQELQECPPKFGLTHIANDLTIWAEAHANGNVDEARALIQSAYNEALALLDFITEMAQIRVQ
jgi:hypothetical protein